MEPGLTTEQIIRVEALNAAIKFVRVPEIVSRAERSMYIHEVIDRAQQFVPYITDGVTNA